MAKTAIRRKAAPKTRLETKKSPSQDRSRATFDAVLAATADLLNEVGFERLSTNMICERAGLTPPALYRYFPNKYAVLKELASRLMDRQDEAVFAWLGRGGFDYSDLDIAIPRFKEIQDRVNQITREQPGGIWIMRAIRAIPLLHDVRMASRDKVIESSVEHTRRHFPNVSDEQLRVATKLTTELAYAATEMVLAEPDRDAEAVTHQLCVMTSLYYRWLYQTTNGVTDDPIAGKQ